MPEEAPDTHVQDALAAYQERNEVLLRSVGAIEDEPESTLEGPDFDGGSYERESANEHPQGAGREHYETVVALADLAKQARFGA